MAAEAAISTVVQLLGNLLIEEVKFIQGVEDQLRSLKDELTRMQAFLKDANKKQTEDERVRNWISEIREVALDAEDTIEMFTLNVETAKSRGLLQRYAFYPNHVRHLHRIGKEIQSILARLAEIRLSRETYGIKDLGESGESGEPAGRSEVEGRRRLAPWEKNEHLVGVEDDVKKLLEPIMDQENKSLSLVAVVGMGGIGKSTLAREVYNHPHVVSGRFHCRAWVAVSSEFTPQETVKQLILETTGFEQQKQDLLKEIKELEDSMRDELYLQEKLKELLHKQLEGKTYFIVLDDVWEKNHLDSLITAFPKQDKTSRLLFTSRNKDTANQCQILHEMEFLDSEKSWELFLNKGFGNSNVEFPNELEHIGRQIVERCQGLPLAITVIGGLLAETRSNREWKEALNQLDSHLKRAESSISTILELSYQNLPPQLRSCFLCLAFFKEDATISVKRLVNIMIGQGLIQHTGSTMTDEEISRCYLHELINRNVVQVKDLTLDNRVKSCHLHDSLRNICLKKAKEEIGLENLTGDRKISLHKPRHLVVQCNDLGSFGMDQNKHIRSLFVINLGDNIKEMKSSYWKSFQHLKNLDLDGDFVDLSRLPHSFRLLHGLKQLRIHGRRITELKLPTWLNTLKKLEILDLSTLDVKSPNIALEIISLRHMHGLSISELMITDSWKNVETLKYIVYKDWMKSSSRMKEAVRHIQKLGIFLLDSKVLLQAGESGRMRASLEKLNNLVKLYLRWRMYFLPIDVAIIIPRLRSLTKLKLWGMMIKCLSASKLPPNLSHLTLYWSNLNEDPMQELSKLRRLSYLKLKLRSFLGVRMQVLRDGFPSLRGLLLQELYGLSSIDVEEGGMPQLKLLQVDRCPNLDTKNLSNKSYKLQIL